MIAQGATVGTRLTREALAYSGGEKDSKFHVVEVLRRRFRNSDVIANGNGRFDNVNPRDHFHRHD